MADETGRVSSQVADTPSGYANSPAQSQNAWLTIIVIGAVYTAAFLDRQTIALLVDPIRAHMEITDFQASLLLGLAFSMFYAVMNVPAGILVDRVDRRRLLLIAGTCWSAASIACGLAETYWQLFAARMVLGGAEAFVTPSAFALMRDRVPQEMQGRGFSVLAMSPYLGGALALVLGGALLRSAMSGTFDGVLLIGGFEPWQVVLVCLGAFAFLPVLLLFLIKPDGERGGTTAEGQGLGFVDGIRHIHRYKLPYAVLFGYATSASMLTFGKGAWMPTMMSRTYDIPLPEVGLISGPVSLISALTGLALCGIILDRIAKNAGGYATFAVGTAALTSLGMVLAPLAPTETLGWTAYGLSSFFGGVFYPIGAIFLARLTPSLMMGKVTALYLLAQNLIGSAVGPMIIAYLSDNWFAGRFALGHAFTLYSAVFGATAVGLALMLDRFCKPSQPKQAASTA